MIEKHLFQELGDRLSDAVRHSPAQDLENNLRALLLAFFDRYDLIAREDFEVQKKLLERAQAKLAALEARVVELETRSKPPRTRVRGTNAACSGRQPCAGRGRRT
jgi:BMFP domain-containing protein YqiC